MYTDSYYSYLNTQGNNVIYYDPYFHERKSEIYNDTENFKEVTNGAFIFLMNIDTLILVCEDIKKNTQNAKFDLVVGDSEDITQKAIDKLREKKYINIFKRICIFTYYVSKYKNISDKYPEIKGVFFLPREVREFIKSGNNDTIVYRTLILITKKNYQNKFISFHETIKQNYGKLDNSDFESAKLKANYYLDDLRGYDLKIRPKSGSKKDAYNEIFRLYQNLNYNKKKIIHNYTCEFNSVYQDFNYALLRLNKRFIDSFSWFIANLQFSLDKYYEDIGLRKNITLYKGMKLDIIEIINYERFEGQTICIPCFFSTSTDIDVARRFGGRGGDIHVEVRKQKGQFSVVFTIKYNYTSGKPYCYDIEDISQFKEIEKERLFIPFTFFKVKKVELRLELYECDIEMESIRNDYL